MPDSVPEILAAAIDHHNANRLTEAAAFRRAADLRPDYADAYKNLGILLRDMGRLEDAGAACRQAIALQPDFAEAHLSPGNVLRDQGHLTLAADCFR